MAVCDRCETPYHPGCVVETCPVGRGPWYCQICRGYLLLHSSTDPIEDVALLDYLFRGLAPDDEADYARVQRLASTYRATGEELETEVLPFGRRELRRWVPVPPVPMRRGIVRDIHEATGHVGRDKLAESVLSRWWWPGARVTVMQVVASCPVC